MAGPAGAFDWFFRNRHTGAITIGHDAFGARDGAALRGGQTVTITAQEDAEIVLVDSD